MHLVLQRLFRDSVHQLMLMIRSLQDQVHTGNGLMPDERFLWHEVLSPGVHRPPAVDDAKLLPHQDCTEAS